MRRALSVGAVLAVCVLVTMALPAAAANTINETDGFEDGTATDDWYSPSGNATISTTGEARTGSFAMNVSHDQGGMPGAVWNNTTVLGGENRISAFVNLSDGERVGVGVRNETTGAAYVAAIERNFNLDFDKLVIAKVYPNGTITELNLSLPQPQIRTDQYYNLTLTYNRNTGLMEAILRNNTNVVNRTTATDTEFEPTIATAATEGSYAFFDDVEFNASSHAPAIDNDSAAPTGPQQTAPTALSINVSDADFPDDTVTVEFYHKGPNDNSFSLHDTDTLTANGTASVPSPADTGGSHEWYVWANDSVHQVRSDSNVSKAGNQTFNYSLPVRIQIRNESEPHNLVKQPAGVEVRIFGSNDTLDKRTITDGNISLRGLPVNETYVFIVNPDGYHQRAVVIESLFEQTDIYVYNKSLPSVRVNFQIDDQTGKFVGSSETKLIIEKAINRSLFDANATGGYDWETVAGDRVGATTEFAVDLEENGRYRLLVTNDEETRVLGEYTAESDTDPEILPIGQLEFRGDTESGAAVEARLREFDSGARDIRVVYFDSQDVTSELNITITNSSGNVLYDASITDPSRTHVATVPVPQSAADNETWTVVINATRTDAEDFDTAKRVGGVTVLTKPWPIDGQVLELLGWVTWFAMTGLVALRSPRHTPAAAVAVGFVFTTLGIYHIPPALMGIGGTIAVFTIVAGDRQ